MKSPGLDDVDKNSHDEITLPRKVDSFDDEGSWSEGNEEINVNQKKSTSIEEEGGGELDVIEEGGNSEDEVLAVLDKNLL